MAHYRIYELDSTDRVVTGYSVMCRSDAAALAMASKGAETDVAAVEVWEDIRCVARLGPKSARSADPRPLAPAIESTQP